MPSVAIFVSIVVVVAVLAVFVGLGQIIAHRSDSVRRRLDVLLLPSATGTTSPEPERKGRFSLARQLNQLLPRRDFSIPLREELTRADIPLTISEYALISIGGGLLCFLLLLVALRQIPFALPGLALGLMLPRFYMRRKQRKRFQAFQDQLPDVLTLLVGCLRSGYGLTIAMDTVAKQMPPPAGVEFGRVVREIGLGASITQALSNLVRRIRSDDLDLVVTAISIQHETGGNLAAILETISETIHERIRLKGQLHVLTSQQYLQRYILTALPIGLGLIMYVLNPDYITALFTPGLTLLIPIGAAVCVVIGYIVMGKLSQVEF